MKRTFVVFSLCAGLAIGAGNAVADGCDTWSKGAPYDRNSHSSPDRTGSDDGKKQAGDSDDAKTAERYCAMEQEPELLALLRELEELKTSPAAGIRRGGESLVRKKYRIARRLRKFDDCRAEDALKELIRENACEDLGEGDILCVRWGAEASLEEVTSKKDMKKLSAAPSAEELLRLVKKYGPHPHTNEFASHEIMNYLIDQADTRPDRYVPLLIEYFTRCHEVIPIARRYPGATDIGLLRCFASSNPATVWAGISLARSLDKKQFLSRVFAVAFQEKGNIDYSQTAELEVIRTMALGYFRMFEADALPYYRAILHGDYGRDREYVISGIRDLKNPAILALLREYDAYLAGHPDRADTALRTRLREKIAIMERAGR